MPKTLTQAALQNKKSINPKQIIDSKQIINPEYTENQPSFSNQQIDRLQSNLELYQTQDSFEAYYIKAFTYLELSQLLQNKEQSQQNYKQALAEWQKAASINPNCLTFTLPQKIPKKPKISLKPINHHLLDETIKTETIKTDPFKKSSRMNQVQNYVKELRSRIRNFMRVVNKARNERMIFDETANNLTLLSLEYEFVVSRTQSHSFDSKVKEVNEMLLGRLEILEREMTRIESKRVNILREKINTTRDMLYEFKSLSQNENISIKQIQKKMIERSKMVSVEQERERVWMASTRAQFEEYCRQMDLRNGTPATIINNYNTYNTTNANQNTNTDNSSQININKTTITQKYLEIVRTGNIDGKFSAVYIDDPEYKKIVQNSAETLSELLKDYPDSIREYAGHFYRRLTFFLKTYLESDKEKQNLLLKGTKFETFVKCAPAIFDALSCIPQFGFISSFIQNGFNKILDSYNEQTFKLQKKKVEDILSAYPNDQALGKQITQSIVELCKRKYKQLEIKSPPDNPSCCASLGNICGCLGKHVEGNIGSTPQETLQNIGTSLLNTGAEKAYSHAIGKKTNIRVAAIRNLAQEDLLGFYKFFLTTEVIGQSINPIEAYMKECFKLFKLQQQGNLISLNQEQEKIQNRQVGAEQAQKEESEIENQEFQKYQVVQEILETKQDVKKILTEAEKLATKSKPSKQETNTKKKEKNQKGPPFFVPKIAHHLQKYRYPEYWKVQTFCTKYCVIY